MCALNRPLPWHRPGTCLSATEGGHADWPCSGRRPAHGGFEEIYSSEADIKDIVLETASVTRCAGDPVRKWSILARLCSDSRWSCRAWRLPASWVRPLPAGISSSLISTPQMIYFDCVYKVQDTAKFHGSIEVRQHCILFPFSTNNGTYRWKLSYTSTIPLAWSGFKPFQAKSSLFRWHFTDGTGFLALVCWWLCGVYRQQQNIPLLGKDKIDHFRPIILTLCSRAFRKQDRWKFGIRPFSKKAAQTTEGQCHWSACLGWTIRPNYEETPPFCLLQIPNSQNSHFSFTIYRLIVKSVATVGDNPLHQSLTIVYLILNSALKSSGVVGFQVHISARASVKTARSEGRGLTTKQNSPSSFALDDMEVTIFIPLRDK